MSDCLFCKIIQGKIPATKVYEDEFVLAFKDLYPQAKDHYLFIHKVHSQDILDMTQIDPNQVSAIFRGISNFIQNCDLKENGFRTVTNCGKDAGQVIFHTHFHVLGGEKLRGFGR